MFHFNAAYMKSQYKQTNYTIYSNDNSSPFQVLGLILMLQRYEAIYRKKKRKKHSSIWLSGTCKILLLLFGICFWDIWFGEPTTLSVLEVGLAIHLYFVLSFASFKTIYNLLLILFDCFSFKHHPSIFCLGFNKIIKVQ